jgi:hypothetical protein
MVLQPPIPAKDTTHPLDHHTVGITVRCDAVMIAKYGKGYRWWPNPESRKRGSQRWAVPAVEQWHPAASIAEISATFQAWESTL